MVQRRVGVRVLAGRSVEFVHSFLQLLLTWGCLDVMMHRAVGPNAKGSGLLLLCRSCDTTRACVTPCNHRHHVPNNANCMILLLENNAVDRQCWACSMCIVGYMYRDIYTYRVLSIVHHISPQLHACMRSVQKPCDGMLRPAGKPRQAFSRIEFDSESDPNDLVPVQSDHQTGPMGQLSLRPNQSMVDLLGRPDNGRSMVYHDER